MSNQITNVNTPASICSRELKRAYQITNNSSLSEKEIVHSIKENCIDTRRELDMLNPHEEKEERAQDIVGMICDAVIAGGAIYSFLTTWSKIKDQDDASNDSSNDN